MSYFPVRVSFVFDTLIFVKIVSKSQPIMMIKCKHDLIEYKTVQ